MKRVKQNFKKRIARQSQKLIDEDRRGSVIIVVITLLSVLMLLGFFLFAQTQQEVQNAEFFAQAAKKYEPLDVDPNTIFDAYLRQLILGADPDTEYNSGFYGGYNSLLPRMLGSDFAPFSGEGVNVVWGNGDATLGAGEQVRADLDYDGLADDGFTDPDGVDRTGLIGINQGPAGKGSVQDFYSTLPQPDVDYSYPDHNSPYLTYYGYVPVLNQTTGQPTGASQLVVIPAFHRPALIRNVGGSAGVPAAANWYSAASTRDRVLRPHQSHSAFDSTGNANGVRFPTTTVGSLTSTFWGSVPTPDEGHWGDNNLDGNYQYDADPTGRGWNDAVYMDIGFPVQVDATTGRLFVPLVAATILDAEAMVNLNVHGNSSKYIVQGGTDITVAPFGDPGGAGDFLSSSNFGITRSEINPGWVLSSGPGEAPGTATEQHEYLFGHTPAGWGELSNMELWNLLHGRPEFGGGSPIPAGQGDKIAQYPGRHGEEIAFDQAALYTTRNSSNFPWPGATGTDNNSNQLTGVSGASPAFWNPSFGYPLDIFATGTNVNGGNGRIRLLHTDTGGRNIFPAYGNVASNSNVAWTSLLGSNLMPSGFARNFFDESNEIVTADTVTDPGLLNSQVNDSIYEVSESALMQLSTFDLAATGTTGRLLNLASFNFVDGAREEEIRSKFTTLSSDLKAYSRGYYGLGPAVARPWEFGDADTDGIPDFPPTLTAFPLADNRQPFRPALRELLFQEVTDKNANDFRKLQRKLQVNGVLDFDANNELAFRPLTPHPTAGVLATAVVSQTGFRSSRFTDLPGSPTLPSTSPAAQEILARIDRQKLARDIYTMLYVLGGGTDGVNYLTTSNDPTRNLYSLTECREMAQMAVNLVDYMDSDHVMTKFEYDINLADGWNLDDYPYAGTGFGSTDTTDIDAGGQRGVVYGVEEQLLALSEGTAIYTDVVEDSSNNPVDHEATEWDDTKRHQFFFLELENVSAFNFGSAADQFNINNDIFQVVVRPQEWTAGLDPLVDAPTTTFNERRLTLQSGALNSLGTGNDRRLTIGSVSELTAMSASNNNVAPVFPASAFLEGTQAPADGTSPGPARFMISQNYSGGSSAGPVKVYPFDIGVGSADYLDLLNETGDFRLFEDPAAATDYEDGPEVTGSSKGAEILDLPDPTTFTPGGTRLVEVILRRRANPNRALSDPENAGQAEDNPWVVVDRMQFPLEFFGIDDEMDDQTRIESFLQSFGTNGRYQPLFGSTEDTDMDSVPDSMSTTAWDSATYQTNTLGGLNDSATNPFTIWHHHANRDYVSLAELFNIPLYGPDDLNGPDAPNAPLNASTGQGPWRGLTVNLGEDLSTTPGTPDVKLTGTTTFGHAVLHPEGPDGDPNLTADNNRWHRVLEFLEVPTRQNIPGFTETVGRVADGGQDAIYRDYGPLNLNTIRNPEVYGGMLDAFDIMNFTNRTTDFPGLPDRLGDDHRSDWWASFAASRDQYDPVLLGSATPTFAAIPGIPGVSRPFRSMSFNGGGVDSIQSTILRDMPFDTENRHLLEIGAVNAGATINDPANYTVDYDLKNKLLGKVMNHSTTQSNTFFVFLQVDYFEATVVNGITRVGGKLPDSPGYRGFYVVDRAKALETLTGDDLPPTVDNNTMQPTFSFNQNFNWRALVLHRQRLN